MKKNLCFALALAATFVAGVCHAEATGPFPVLVCRAHQCANASYSMSRGFLFNKINQMLQNNRGKSILICEADPASHICLHDGIVIPAKTSFSDVDVVIEGMKLTDERLVPGTTEMDVVLDYKIRANNTFPRCQLGVSRLGVGFLDKVELTTDDILCAMTETGRTALNATYTIDYLDFDYGFIGAYYTVGVGEAVRGEKSGYVLMRMTAEPALPDLDEVIEETVVVEEETISPEPVPRSNIQTLPDILLETMPAGTEQAAEPAPEPVAEPEPAPQPAPKAEPVPEPTPAAEPAAPAAPVTETIRETITETTQISSQPTAVPVQKPTVIRTTVVEKTVITPDGKRQVTPPEKRTFVNGEEQIP